MAGSAPETQLDFEKQVFVELLSDDGLVIQARQVLLGLSWRYANYYSGSGFTKISIVLRRYTEVY